MRIGLKLGRTYHVWEIDHHTHTKQPSWMVERPRRWRLLPRLLLTYPDGAKRWWPGGEMARRRTDGGEVRLRRCDLPVGTYVQVVPTQPLMEDGDPPPPYRAKIVGYDTFGSKYMLGREYAPGEFTTCGWWAFSSEVTEVDQ